MSDDPYMECPIYAERGACSCSQGVYGNTCAMPGGLGDRDDDRLFALQADNHRLRAAIGRHRERVFSLGINVDRKGNRVHGSEWDRDLWSALYGSLVREDTCVGCGGQDYDEYGRCTKCGRSST